MKSNPWKVVWFLDSRHFTQEYSFAMGEHSKTLLKPLVCSVKFLVQYIKPIEIYSKNKFVREFWDTLYIDCPSYMIILNSNTRWHTTNWMPQLPRIATLSVMMKHRQALGRMKKKAANKRLAPGGYTRVFTVVNAMSKSFLTPRIYGSRLRRKSMQFAANCVVLTLRSLPLYFMLYTLAVIDAIGRAIDPRG